MRKYFIFWCIVFTFPLPMFAQPGNFIGTWQGALNLGVELRVVFHISADGKGGFSATADSPDQSAYGFKCDTVIIKNNELIIEMKTLSASFAGKMLNDSTIEGTFTQNTEMPLVLKRTDKVTERQRPQTPKPPFPYKSEEVEYNNNDRSLRYGATITVPEGKGPFPALVMITGSGQQDRDETIIGHKLFAVIADHLTRKGVIVLRVDDRGIGKSTGDFSTATSADFAKDVSSSVDYLLSRPEVDKTKIGLLGHSEGGMIAPLVAIQRTEVNFIVMLAGPGVRIVDLMAEQNEAIARSAGVSDSALKEIKPLFRRVALAITNAKDSSTAVAEVSMITENWAVLRSKTLLEELNFGTAQKRYEYIVEMVKQFQSPWFRYFINFSPQPYLAQLECKVLALNGDKDIQVISSQNIPGIEAALKRSRSKVYDVKELPGLNHLFQTCKKCTVEEYGELEETISPLALEEISEWLIKNVK